jgi:hypothetical protein
MQNYEMNIEKETAALSQGYNIVFIDEEHGLLNFERWNELNEYICA